MSERITTKEEAIAEAKERHSGKWGSSAAVYLIVAYNDGDHRAIPAAYLDDISYTGSRRVVAKVVRGE
jgi:hypothetical protein